MPALPLADNPLEILKTRLVSGVNATPLCVAITGWIADAPTNPSVAEIRRSAEGDILLRLSDEETPCSFFEFLKEVRVICLSFGLSESQTARVATEVRRRLG